MKATALLKKQHRKVETTFEKLEKGKGDATILLDELANELTAHMVIEQTIFYPAVRELDPEMVGESYEEHAIAELALKRLLSTTPDDATFVPKVIALKELIEHHVEEEEEELFPEVEDEMDDERLESLGEEMTMAFEGAIDQGYQSLLPEGLEASGDRENESSPSTSTPRRAKRGGRQPRRSAE